MFLDPAEIIWRDASTKKWIQSQENCRAAEQRTAQSPGRVCEPWVHYQKSAGAAERWQRPIKSSLNDIFASWIEIYGSPVAAPRLPTICTCPLKTRKASPWRSADRCSAASLGLCAESGGSL